MVVQLIVDFLVLGLLGFLVSTTLLLWYLFLDSLVKNRILTYSPRLKPGDSGINKDCTSRDGLTSSPPTDDAPPA